MVIETCGDVVYLSGSLLSNQWAAIKTAAYLVEARYPRRVFVDFAGVNYLSRLGELTLTEALHDIERRRLPFVLTNVPDELAARLEALSAGYGHEYTEQTAQTQRMYQAIFSETWWQRLWGTR